MKFVERQGTRPDLYAQPKVGALGGYHHVTSASAKYVPFREPGLNCTGALMLAVLYRSFSPSSFEKEIVAIR